MKVKQTYVKEKHNNSRKTRDVDNFSFKLWKNGYRLC